MDAASSSFLHFFDFFGFLIPGRLQEAATHSAQQPEPAGPELRAAPGQGKNFLHMIIEDLISHMWRGGEVMGGKTSE